MNSSEASLPFHSVNGSLFPWLSELDFWKALPLHTTDPHINLIHSPDGTPQLLFPQEDGNFSMVLPMVSMLLRDSGQRVPIWCTYPLSGSYDFLPRILFYTTLIFAVVFRHSSWISSAALGTAMTYSSVAAIHFFILLSVYKWDASYPEWDRESSVKFGDIDFFGIIPVVSAAGVMIAPISVWSSTFRTHRARPVIVLWALLIFAALVPALVMMRSYLKGGWSPNDIPSFAYCTEPGDNCNWAALYVDDGFTYEASKACKCVDFCGVISPDAPLRSGVTMVPDVGRKISRRATSTDSYARLTLTVMVVWVIAAVQGILHLVLRHWNMLDVRNWIFRVLYDPRREIIVWMFRGSRRRSLLRRYYSDSSPVARPGRFRVIFALGIATLAYFIAIAAALIYPAAFIITIVLNELMVSGFPVSEHSDSVGAWTPWVAGGLVSFAALIVRYNVRIEAIAYGLLFAPVNWAMYDATDRPRLRDLFKRDDNDADLKPKRRRGVWRLLRQIQEDISGRLQSNRERVGEFRRFWTDPVRVSAREEKVFEGEPKLTAPRSASTLNGASDGPGLEMQRQGEQELNEIPKTFAGAAR